MSGLLEHHWTPTFYTDLEASVGGIHWSGMSGGVCAAAHLACVGTGVLSPHAITWLIGADIGWNPVTNLNFDLELMYQHVTQECAERQYRDDLWQRRVRSGQLGKATAAASKVVSASPVTSDRIPIG